MGRNHVHPEEIIVVTSCAFCDKTFGDKAEYVGHLVNYHRIDIVRYERGAARSRSVDRPRYKEINDPSLGVVISLDSDDEQEAVPALDKAIVPAPASQSETESSAAQPGNISETEPEATDTSYQESVEASNEVTSETPPLQGSQGKKKISLLLYSSRTKHLNRERSALGTGIPGAQGAPQATNENPIAAKPTVQGVPAPENVQVSNVTTNEQQAVITGSPKVGSTQPGAVTTYSKFGPRRSQKNNEVHVARDFASPPLGHREAEHLESPDVPDAALANILSLPVLPNPVDVQQLNNGALDSFLQANVSEKASQWNFFSTVAPPNSLTTSVHTNRTDRVEYRSRNVDNNDSITEKTPVMVGMIETAGSGGTEKLKQHKKSSDENDGKVIKHPDLTKPVNIVERREQFPPTDTNVKPDSRELFPDLLLNKSNVLVFNGPDPRVFQVHRDHSRSPAFREHNDRDRRHGRSYSLRYEDHYEAEPRSSKSIHPARDTRYRAPRGDYYSEHDGNDNRSRPRGKSGDRPPRDGRGGHRHIDRAYDSRVRSRAVPPREEDSDPAKEYDYLRTLARAGLPKDRDAIILGYDDYFRIRTRGIPAKERDLDTPRLCERSDKRHVRYPDSPVMNQDDPRGKSRVAPIISGPSNSNTPVTSSGQCKSAISSADPTKPSELPTKQALGATDRPPVVEKRYSDELEPPHMRHRQTAKEKAGREKKEMMWEDREREDEKRRQEAQKRGRSETAPRGIGGTRGRRDGVGRGGSSTGRGAGNARRDGRKIKRAGSEEKEGRVGKVGEEVVRWSSALGDRGGVKRAGSEGLDEEKAGRRGGRFKR